jgi:hypothetical protein
LNQFWQDTFIASLRELIRLQSTSGAKDDSIDGWLVGRATRIADLSNGNLEKRIKSQVRVACLAPAPKGEVHGRFVCSRESGHEGDHKW